MSGERAWTFAQRFYAHPGISHMLLRLQDDHGVDIPLVLVLLHAALGGRALDAASVDDLARQAGEWQHGVVAPLRQARRALGRDNDDLYERAKALELSAEEAIIRRLGDAPSQVADAPPEVAAFVNLDSYRRLAGLPDDAFDAVLTAFVAYRAEQAL